MFCVDMCMILLSVHSCTILYIHHKAWWFYCLPNPCQHLLSSLFNYNILLCFKWHIIVVWICLFLMTNDAEHLLINWLCIFFEDVCLNPLTIFNWFTYFSQFSSLSYLYILRTRPLLVIIHKYFLLFCGFLKIISIVSSEAQNNSILFL